MYLDVLYNVFLGCCSTAMAPQQTSYLENRWFFFYLHPSIDWNTDLAIYIQFPLGQKLWFKWLNDIDKCSYLLYTVYFNMYNCFDRDTKVHAKLRYRFMYLLWIILFSTQFNVASKHIECQYFNQITVVVMFSTVFHSMEMDLQCFR